MAIERLSETAEYAKWYQRMQARCDKGNLPYPAELVSYLERVHEAKKETPDGREEN